MKIFKKLLINLLILVFLLCIIEAFLYINHNRNNPLEAPEGGGWISYYIGKIPYKSLLLPEKFRPPSGMEFNKNPIIILGCSFAYGYQLDYEDTIGYKLSQLTQRPVYNYAVVGKGLQNSLYILQNNFYDKNIQNPEYIIYIMISDHIRRLYSATCASDFVGYPIYKLKNGKLYLQHDTYPVYRQFYTFYYINNLIYNMFISKNYKLHNKYINAYFNTMRNEIKKKYPDIKFVILVYGDKSNFGLDFSELEKDGFIILQTEEITGINLFNTKYQLSKANTHPNKEAWDIIVPALAKKLNLIPIES